MLVKRVTLGYKFRYLSAECRRIWGYRGISISVISLTQSQATVLKGWRDDVARLAKAPLRNLCKSQLQHRIMSGGVDCWIGSGDEAIDAGDSGF
jgi:hypothetical protein